MQIPKIDWDITIRILEATAWPVVALIGLILLRPMVRSIIRAFAENGGSFSAMGIDAELNAERIEDAAKAVIESAPEQESDLDLEHLRVKLREMSSEELYYEVTGAWSEVSDALNDTYYKKTEEWLDWRSGHKSISKAKKSGLLNEQQAAAIDDLFAVRSSAKRRGPKRFEDMDMDADDVLKYIQATNALANQILKNNS